MKKITFALLIFILAIFPIYSLTIDDILESANRVSYTVKNAELSHQNSLLLLEQSDLDEKAEWNVNLRLSPLQSNEDLTADKQSLNISTLSASVILPNDGDTTITLSSPMTIGYDGKFYINPNLSASHKFDFNYFDDDALTDLENAESKIGTERVYYNAIYSFNKSVISQVSTLLNLEKNIKTLEHTIANSERDLNNMLILKSANENSITYRRSQMELDMNKRSLENYQDQYEKAKNQFSVVTGLEWETIEEFEVPELSLSIMENGNSEVLEKSLRAEISTMQVEQKEKAMNPFALTLSGAIGGAYRTDENYGTNTNITGTGTTTTTTTTGSNVFANLSGHDRLTSSIGAELSISEWTVGTTFSTTSRANFDNFRPALTIYGSWHNNMARESDRLELERLRNTAISDQNEYLDALTNYNINGLTLQNQLMNYTFTLSNMEQNEEYLKAVAESERQYYESGLITEDELRDAEFNYEMAHFDRLITYLEGLSLYYDTLIYSL